MLFKRKTPNTQHCLNLTFYNPREMGEVSIRSPFRVRAALPTANQGKVGEQGLGPAWASGWLSLPPRSIVLMRFCLGCNGTHPRTVQLFLTRLDIQEIPNHSRAKGGAKLFFFPSSSRRTIITANDRQNFLFALMTRWFFRLKHLRSIETKDTVHLQEHKLPLIIFLG